VAFESTLRSKVLGSKALVAALAATALTALLPSQASAEAMLLVEADTGKVLHAENATYPWYPASVTKILTAYITLTAVKSGRLSLDSLIPVSARAAAQAPSKMGFKPGTQVTIDNALKMLFVKSANDIAYVLAEGVGGSIEKFADEMNATSRRLGMTQSHWVNPNGLPADEQVTSARDLAILARAMLKDFPEYEYYWHIPAIQFGKKVMRNTNALIGRYPGADGMKTGFICASGFNLVATATRNNRKLIAVMLGSPSSAVRSAKTASLFERGFTTNNLGWLTPSLGTVDRLTPIAASPPDLREEMCGKHRKRPAAEDADDDTEVSSNTTGEPGSAQSFMLSSLPPSTVKPSSLLAPAGGAVKAIVVYAGAARKSAEAVVAAAKAKLDAKEAKLAAAAAAKLNKQPAANAAAATPVSAPAQAAAGAASVAATTAAPVPQPQTASAQPGAFAPPVGQFSPPGRGMPAVTEGGNPSYMSFAPASTSSSPAPLTQAPPVAAPAAAPAPAPKTQAAGVPMPKPKPKPQPKPVANAAPAAASSTAR
jgi:D-alanyl-D-alanine carboxypeptidase